MFQILTLKIDVTKFDKTAFYVGQKGTYATVAVRLNSEKDQYGNYGMITQDLGKEREDTGEKKPILGNVTKVYTKQENSNGIANQLRPPMQQATPVRGASNLQSEDEIPF
jgi:hypothetical protein